MPSFMTLSSPTPILQKDCERPTSQPPVDALAGSAVQSHQGLVLCILKQDASLNDALGLGSTDMIRVLYSKKLGCISSPVGTGWFQSHHRMQYSLDWIRVAFLLNGNQNSSWFLVPIFPLNHDWGVNLTANCHFPSLTLKNKSEKSSETCLFHPFLGVFILSEQLLAVKAARGHQLPSSRYRIVPGHDNLTWLIWFQVVVSNF